MGRKSRTGQRQTESCQEATSEGAGLSGMARPPHPAAQRSEEWLEESGYRNRLAKLAQTHLLVSFKM